MFDFFTEKFLIKYLKKNTEPQTRLRKSNFTVKLEAIRNILRKKSPSVSISNYFQWTVYIGNVPVAHTFAKGTEQFEWQGMILGATTHVNITAVADILNKMQEMSVGTHMLKSSDKRNQAKKNTNQFFLMFSFFQCFPNFITTTSLHFCCMHIYDV